MSAYPTPPRLPIQPPFSWFAVAICGSPGAQRTRLATLGKFKPIDQFDWNHPRKIDRALYEQLLDGTFIEHAANVLLRGQSGVGKTTLAQNLGHFALQKGYRVRFTTLAQALADLGKHDSLAAFERRLRTYTKPALLLVDSCEVPRYVESA